MMRIRAIIVAPPWFATNSRASMGAFHSAGMIIYNRGTPGFLAARDLLMPHGDALIGLATVLRIKRTLDGTEIDEVIAGIEARKAAAVEHRRRLDWRERELSAQGFKNRLVP